jgi:hypothetical protein
MIAAPLRHRLGEDAMRIAVSMRTIVVLSLVVALPLLALPVAARLIEARLGGGPPIDLAPPPPLAGPAAAVVEPMFVERVSPALYEEPASNGANEPGASAGIDAADIPPPAPATAFHAPAHLPDRAAATAEEIQIDDQTISRLHQVRQRLEELGADYVIVETTDGGGQFRFHCRMIVDANSRFTRPFEAKSADPLAAGEEVLREVEAWRTAGIEKSRRLE